jgi:hypothetical protein
MLDLCHGQATGEPKPPEGQRLDVWRGYAALRGFWLAGFAMKPSGGGRGAGTSEG